MFWSYYALIAALAFCVALFYFAWSLKQKKIPDLIKLLIFSLFFAPFALIGARLWNYLNWPHLQTIIDQGPWVNRLLNFFGFGPHGLRGLSFFGGLLAILLYFIVLFTWYSRKHHVSFLLIFDVLLQAVLIFQIIGRWGNFFNQELLGNIITDNYPQEFGWLPNWFAAKLHFPEEGVVRLRHPLFLYESLANSGLLLVLVLTKRIGVFHLFCKVKNYPVLQKQITSQKKHFVQKYWFGFFLLFWIKKWIIVNCFWKNNVLNPPVNFNHTPPVYINNHIWKWKRPVVSCFYQKQIVYVNQNLPFYSRIWQKICLFWQRNSTKLTKHFNPQKLIIPHLGLTTALYCLGYGLIRFLLQTLREGVPQSEPIAAPYYASVFLFLLGFCVFWLSQLVIPYKWRNPNWFYETWYWKV